MPVSSFSHLFVGSFGLDLDSDILSSFMHCIVPRPTESCSVFWRDNGMGVEFREDVLSCIMYCSR